MYQIGLVSVSFRGLSPEEIIRIAKDAGLSRIEWGSDVHAPFDDAERLSTIAACQRSAGLRCSSYGTYFVLGRDDPAVLSRYIAAAKCLDTSVLRLWCGTKGSSDYTPQELQALYEDCRSAASIAQAHGVTLCMECHNHTLTDTKESALALMEAISSPAFRMYCQPNQLRSEQENLQYLKLLRPYIVLVHVFQWKDVCRFPLADGIEVWKAYLRTLKKETTLLLEFMPDDQPQSLPIEAAALRKIIEEV